MCSLPVPLVALILEFTSWHRQIVACCRLSRTWNLASKCRNAQFKTWLHVHGGIFKLDTWVRRIGPERAPCVAWDWSDDDQVDDMVSLSANKQGGNLCKLTRLAGNQRLKRLSEALLQRVEFHCNRELLTRKVQWVFPLVTRVRSLHTLIYHNHDFARLVWIQRAVINAARPPSISIPSNIRIETCLLTLSSDFDAVLRAGESVWFPTHVLGCFRRELTAWFARTNSSVTFEMVRGSTAFDVCTSQLQWMLPFCKHLFKRMPMILHSDAIEDQILRTHSNKKFEWVGLD
jgi:hypothetical protein